MFFMITAYLAGIGLQWIANYKKSLGIILIIIYASLILQNSVTKNRNLLADKNQLDIENLLLVCPPGCNLLTDDFYTWQEILRYYDFTNPFIKKRKIKLLDNLNLDDGSTNFFIADTIKKQLDNANISYVPVYSNKISTLYIIGRIDKR